MCGIAGFFSPNNNYTKDDLISMTTRLAHRGPDAEGFYNEEFVGLGHKRLSIIDLSDAANQPMHSHNNRYVMVYNGEVYNYKEISKELNRQWKTHSDTEVTLEAFSEWGVDFVHKLNGMFALAIYDKQEKKLFLFRDRIGIKPLFYYWDGESFAFASELKSLLKLEHINKNKVLNKSAISIFLHLGYIPEPLTIYQNIYKFPSGHYAIVSANSLSLKKYWNIEDNIKSELICDFDEAKSKLNELLISSVKYRLISDVPYGTFLSGGTDSSLITAIAQKITDQPVKTFSIGFKESKYNEAPYAKAIADYLGTDHHEFIVSYKDAIPLVEQMINVYDEPYADSSAIPTMLISKLARQYVTMTLSGDGGDELFFGYGTYKWAKRLANPYLMSLKTPISYILSKSPNRYKRMEYLLKYWSREKSKSHISSQEQYLFSEHEIQNMLTNEYKTPPNIDEDILNLSRKLTPIEEQAIFDIRYYLKDDLLVKVDRASMHYSLENRVPLLDHRIVEFALNLSPSLKIKGKNQKYLLKEVLYDYIPAKYFKRPKWGFSIPLDLWLKNELKHLIDDYLSDDIINDFGIIDLQTVQKLKNKFFNGFDYLYNRLWALIILHKWLLNNFGRSDFSTKGEIKYLLTKIERCNMCGSPDIDSIMLGKRLDKPQGKNPGQRIGITTPIVKCKNCDLIYANPMPIPENMNSHYGVPPENYWKSGYFKIEDKYFKKQIKKFHSLYNHHENLTVLDIGAGIGKCMTSLENSGFKVYGLEPAELFYQKAIQEMGIDKKRLKLTTLEDAEYEHGFFDFITFGAVLEHLYDPSLSIIKALNWLKPNGIIHIEVPSSAWLINKLVNLYYRTKRLDYVANISPMHPPYHLYEFGLKSFEEHAGNNNYKIADYKYHVCSTYMPKVLDPLLIPLMAITNTGLQLEVWLRKNAKI